MTPEELRKLAEDEKAMKQSAIVEWRKFLESCPPNTARRIPRLAVTSHTSAGMPYQHLPTVRIQLHCIVDGGFRWFNGPSERGLRETWSYQFLRFDCRDCGRYSKTYSVLIKRSNEDDTDAEVMKLGEFPPFSAPISQRVEKLLGKGDLELYRKGTRAEAQGLGVGAASYFRRVVDNQWRKLVTEIRDAAKQLGVTDLDVYERALNETQFSAAVEMLKDAIPAKLLILDGRNPLTLLYRPLSVQLHALSDEECLQQAADIRLVLAALLENIGAVLANQDELKQAAERLLQPKT